MEILEKAADSLAEEAGKHDASVIVITVSHNEENPKNLDASVKISGNIHKLAHGLGGVLAQKGGHNEMNIIARLAMSQADLALFKEEKLRELEEQKKDNPKNE